MMMVTEPRPNDEESDWIGIIIIIISSKNEKQQTAQLKRAKSKNGS
jgi:hypothetical protein